MGQSGRGIEQIKTGKYPTEATTVLDRFIHFIYNERGRELIFELTTTEDLHNAVFCMNELETGICGCQIGV
jgi:hypothetical protein